MIRSKKALWGRFSKCSSEHFQNRPQDAHMALAVSLAKNGLSHTNPNPMVGAVLVKEGKMIGKGWHPYYGGPHAEIAALQNALEQGHTTEGASLYVTLEPCCHYGKTPPCTEAIISAGIAKVYIGQLDPNPLVSGKGVKHLESQGIQVETGILETQCRSLNKIFSSYIQTGIPYVTLKSAMSLDGRTSDANGRSKWITSEAARAHGRRLRAAHMAIMIGSGTLEKDNPLLSARLPGIKNPIRVLIDRKLRSDLSLQLFKTPEISKVWVYCDENAPLHRMEAFRALGVMVNPCPSDLNLEWVFANLGEQGIDSVLVEGGPTLLGLALATGMVKELHTYIAPCLLGDKHSNPMFAGWEAKDLDQAQKLILSDSRIIGTDLLLQWQIPDAVQIKASATYEALSQEEDSLCLLE